jgi:aryl-alcohol dehydrogenase-like predicted oxidoreductase
MGRTKHTKHPAAAAKEPLEVGAHELLDEDPDLRAAALQAAEAGAPTWYALRSTLLFDRLAPLRALAATRLGEAANHPGTATWLRDALEDPFPLVRQAAHRSLARLRDERSIPWLHRAALEEPVWWVRREAVKALARVGREAAVPTLRRVLEDPIWRVRHAALRALAALGSPADLDEARSPGAAENAALTFLSGRPTGRPPSALEDDGLLNPDPAVTTARVEARGMELPPAELVPLLADPHEPLREAATKILLASEDAGAFEAALGLLEEPRHAHAPAAVRALLDELDWPIALSLARRALEARENAGAAVWALGWFAKHGAEELYDLALSAVGDAGRPPSVRRAAVEALARPGHAPQRRTEVLRALQGALLDEDPAVRSAAVEALAPLAERDAALYTHLALVPRGELAASALAALARAATSVGDLALLVEVASADPHPFVRATALEGLVARRALPPDLRARALADADPWVRAAVLDPAAALELLERGTPEEPRLLRNALDVLVRDRRDATPDLLARAAARCARARDPWLRSRTASLLEPHRPSDLSLLLELSRDREPMVRSSADHELSRRADLALLLDALLADPELPEPIAEAAWGYLARPRTAVVAARLEAALRDADARGRSTLAAHLATLALVLSEEAIAASPVLAARRPTAPAIAALAPAAMRPPRAAPPEVVALRRPLCGDLRVSPIGLSGVYQPSVPALAEAFEAGVNLFFWEPRYLTLTRFLRERRQRRDEMVLVAGSYNGSRSSVREDVERALRRLRTDRIDLFLLFWVRSRERLSAELKDELAALKREGKIRAAGFSTHHRDLAREAITEATRAWDAIMVRHSAAHPGAERDLFPAALERGVGVITFSTLCYGRLLRRPPGVLETPPSAADCYRYSLAQPGVSACLSAPRRQRELDENLELLAHPAIEARALEPLRAFGLAVHRENERFNTLVRKAGRAAAVEAPPLRAEPVDGAPALDAEGPLGPIDLGSGEPDGSHLRGWTH